MAAAFGKFHAGMDGQPVAHTDLVWNVAGMVLVGLAASLAGGCPVRQFVLAGEGDADAGIVFTGMLVGAALSHNFGMVSTPAGPTLTGKIAVGVGFVFCVAAGLASRAEAAEAGHA